MNSENKKKPILFIILAVVILGIMIFVTVKYAPQIKDLFSLDGKGLHNFRDYILSYGNFGIFIYILIQALQVIIAAIPGEPVQAAAGYIYGTFWGSVVSNFGMLIGSLIAFYIARIVGMPIVEFAVPKKHLERYKFLLNSSKGESVMFLIFIIPGIPKDFMIYIAGISPIKSLKFFLLYFIARLPGNIAWAYFGAHIQTKEYAKAIILGVVFGILFIICFIYREKILHWLENKLLKKLEK